MSNDIFKAVTQCGVLSHSLLNDESFSEDFCNFPMLLERGTFFFLMQRYGETRFNTRRRQISMGYK